VSCAGRVNDEHRPPRELAVHGGYLGRMLPRLQYDGAVDADGHVLEPPDLWDRLLEPRFRDRPMGIRRDAEGLEYLEIAGDPPRWSGGICPRGSGRWT